MKLSIWIIAACATTVVHAQQTKPVVLDLVEYQAGPNWQADKAPEEQDLAGHFNLVTGAFKDKRLLAFGPTPDDMHGHYLYLSGSADSVVSNDPGLKNGVLSVASRGTWTLLMENLSADIGDDQLFFLDYLPGPAWKKGKTLAEQEIQGHMAYVAKLFEETHLIAGGPTSETSGRYLASPIDKNAAAKIVANDPSVKAKTFTVKISPWAPFQRQGHAR